MKKFSLLVIAIAGLVQSAYAADTSSTLAITGSVPAETASCTVSLDRSSLVLNGDLKNMITQDSTIKTGANVLINVASNYSEQSMKCRDLADQGKLAYRFLGTADDAEGTSLANTDVDVGAAKGVGIGIYSNGTLIRVNEDVLPATSYGNTVSLTLVKLKGQQATTGNVESVLTIQFDRI